jgi:tetratricopeptide (TPR) repeat protein
MKPKLFLFVTLTALLYGSVAMAQEKHEHPVGKPEELGNVYFPVSCSAAAQKQFERAIAMLHSFWYEEAEKAFAEVTATDPSCAMGYWGIAMSLYHPIWYPPDTASLKKGGAAIQKAKSVGVKTDRERDYVAAIETFYKDSDKLDHRTHAVAYEKAMEKLYLRYPDDREAAAFYALALLSTAPSTDKTYANQKKAARILEKIFTEQPKHPGASHYIIHSFDYPALASLALPPPRGTTRRSLQRFPTHSTCPLTSSPGWGCGKSRFSRTWPPRLPRRNTLSRPTWKVLGTSSFTPWITLCMPTCRVRRTLK